MSSDKRSLRKALRTMRRGLSDERRGEAAEALLRSLHPRMDGFNHVLSFASFGCEVDLWPLNQQLASEGRLLLPRVEGEDLGIYHVTDIESQLLESSLGIREPIPELCPKFEVKDIEVVFTAGLGFDTRGHRLGYGRGYYDRLIDKCPTALTVGVGFKEQRLEKDLPTELHDRPVEELWLV